MSARTLALVALLALTGCSSHAAATPTPAPTIGSVGQPVAFTDQLQKPPSTGTITINSARRIKAGDGDPYSHYGTYLQLDVTIAVNAGEMPTDSTEFEAKGKSGHSYGFLPFADSQALQGTARAGVLSRGNVDLDAPASDGPYRIVWSYGGMAGSTARAEFSING